jgi:predicted dehydrogenase
MDFVCVVTPNNMHYPVTMAAVDSGFHVICEKPMTTSMDEATNLVRKLKDTNRLFCVTNLYTGFAMVKEARAIVAGRKIGNVRRVVVEHPQGWLATRLETAGHKQAAWRMDPHRVGLSCCMSDIGVQAESLLVYVTGEEVSEVCADLHSFVKGRVLDDDGSVLLRMASGASGILWASQITVGEENDMRLRVYGEKGTIEWSLRTADELRIYWIDRPMEIRRAGTPFTSVPPNSPSRMPVGFGGGYIEPLANIYRAFAAALTRFLDGGKIVPGSFDYPTAQDGLRGVTFVDAVVASSKGPDKWIKVGAPRPPAPPKPPEEVEGF